MDAESEGYQVDIHSQDTDVLLLALCRVPQLGQDPVMIVGTGDHRYKINLQDLYNKFGSDRASASIN